MKKLFFTLIAFAAITASAQNGVSNPYRFGQGEDSTRCIQSISIMNTNMKNKEYKIAYDAWKVLFDEFPVARVDTYTNGIKILTEFIKKEKDAKKKGQYVDMLLSVYDQEIKYIDQLQEITKTPLSEGQILGKKAIDCIKYRKNTPVNEIYDMLSRSVELEKGESVAVNGVCLTVVDFNRSRFTADVLKETEERSTLGSLLPGAKVNLERALRAGEPLGGHIVQGHVDQTACCIAIDDQEGSWQFTFQYESSKDMVRRGYFCVDKGSITVNGVSLTVCRPTEDTFQVCIIPYTFEHTNFHNFQVGTVVNLEFDIIGKYLARMNSLL